MRSALFPSPQNKVETNSNEPITKIALLVAMEEEAQPIIEALSMTSRITTLNFGIKSYQTLLNNATIDLFVQGKREGASKVGALYAGVATYEIITKIAPQLIISVGTAGGIDINPLTVIIGGEKFFFHDRFIDVKGYEKSSLGDLSCFNLSMVSSLLNIEQHIISTGESLEFYEPHKKIVERTNAKVLDMEVCGIAQIAAEFDKKVAAIKVITNAPNNSEQFLKNLIPAAKILAETTKKILNCIIGKTPDELANPISVTQQDSRFRVAVAM